MSEISLSKDIVLPSEEDEDSIFLGKIKLEDLRSKSLTRQLERECNSTLKQNFIEESESKIELDDVLDSVNVAEYELDRWFFSRWLEIGEAFWKRILKLLSFINEAFSLNLDLKLTDKLILTKEKQKRKNLLFSFLDAIRKKFFKKELTLEEMLELQIKALEEQLGSENDLEVIHQIKKQLEFLMELRAKLFKLSLEQELNKTTKWLFTIGAMQTVAEMARGLYKSKEIVVTKGQWQKVDNLLNSDRSSRKVSSNTCDSMGVESVKTKPFASTNQNNNFGLIPISQGVAKDGNGFFLKLLYTLLLLANTYVMKHIGLGIDNDSEVRIHKATQRGLAINKASYQKGAVMIQGRTVELQGGQVFFNISKSQDAKLKREVSTTLSNNVPNSELKEPKIQVINNSKACVER